MAALTEYPDLIDTPEASKLFPKDVLERARQTINEIGSTGAYSHSMGVPAIRKRVAKFIEGQFGVQAQAPPRPRSGVSMRDLIADPFRRQRSDIDTDQVTCLGMITFKYRTRRLSLVARQGLLDRWSFGWSLKLASDPYLGPGRRRLDSDPSIPTVHGCARSEFGARCSILLAGTGRMGLEH